MAAGYVYTVTPAPQGSRFFCFDTRSVTVWIKILDGMQFTKQVFRTKEHFILLRTTLNVIQTVVVKLEDKMPLVLFDAC